MAIAMQVGKVQSSLLIVLGHNIICKNNCTFNGLSKHAFISKTTNNSTISSKFKKNPYQ
jgi:hypothetical protein